MFIKRIMKIQVEELLKILNRDGYMFIDKSVFYNSDLKIENGILKINTQQKFENGLYGFRQAGYYTIEFDDFFDHFKHESKTSLTKKEKSDCLNLMYEIFGEEYKIAYKEHRLQQLERQEKNANKKLIRIAKERKKFENE